MINKNEVGSLCRIKVNKMLSSLNSNKNIFIPKYTILSKKEEQYSHLNQAKGNPIKYNYNTLSTNHISNKSNLNRSHITTTEENYNNQPIDFIINHGVLVYQRNFKGEEIVNLGINNEYLRKNKFNMVKNDNSIYQTDTNFRTNNDIIVNKNYNYATVQKRMKMSGSRRTLKSMTDFPLAKNDYSSSRQKKIISTNLNTTTNSVSSLNSVSVKNFLITGKNKKNNNNINKNMTNPNLKLQNKKVSINYVRKKKKNDDSPKKYLIYKKKTNYDTIVQNDKNYLVNNISEIKDINEIQKIHDNKYNTASVIKSTKNKNRIANKKSNIMLYNNPKFNNNMNMNMNKLSENKIKKLMIKIRLFINYYLKDYFSILKEHILRKRNHIINYEENCKNNNNILNEEIKNLEGKINKIDLNKISIENCRQNKNFINTGKDHKKSNSIIVNKKLSSNSINTKELQNNKINNSNINNSSINNNNVINKTQLAYLITKNIKFFSRDRDDNSVRRETELFRDSKSLQKKYEQICRRKKKNMTMTFSNKFKDATSVIDTINNISDINKTNSFSNIYDTNSVNSLQIKQNKKKFNQIFYKENSASSNNNENADDKAKNFTGNKNDKNLYKIKLVKTNTSNNKKVISYRIEKKTPESISNENTTKDNDKQNYVTCSEFKNYFNISNNNKQLYEKENHNLYDNKDKKMNDSKKEINNINNINTNNASNNNNNTNQLNKKVYIHRKKNYLLEDKKNFTIKEIYTKTEKDIKSSKCIKLLIKNICTKDKRIFIRVTYIPYVYKSKKNLKYLNTVYSIDNNIKYNYIASNKRIKNLLKRKNDLEKKLSLIKEEDEKSRCLNSTKSSKMFEEEINSTNKNHKYVKITKEITHFNLQVTKMVKRLEKYFNNSNIDLKKDFIYKLKIISLVSYIRKIIINKIKDTYIAKCLRRNKRYVIDENKIIQDKIKRKKMKENIQQISNIYIKDKIFLNNIIINDHFLSSRSFDYNKEFNKFESPQLKHNKYRKYNDYDIDDDKPKTERFNCNYIEENH
jgi:hypothetical protein